MRINSILLLLFLAISSTSHAVSFDCAKASTPVEKAICSDPLLSKLDDALADNYKSSGNANIGDGQRKDLKATQRQWLADRNKCNDKKCLVEIYKQRIDSVCEYTAITGARAYCVTADEVVGVANNAVTQSTPSKQANSNAVSSTPSQSKAQQSESQVSGVNSEIKTMVDNNAAELVLRENIKIDSPFCAGAHKSLASTYNAVGRGIIFNNYKLAAVKHSLGELSCKQFPIPSKTSEYLAKENKATQMFSTFYGSCYKNGIGYKVQERYMLEVGKNLETAPCSTIDIFYRAYMDLFRDLF